MKRNILLSAVLMAVIVAAPVLAHEVDNDKTAKLHQAAMTGKLDVIKNAVADSSMSLEARSQQGATLLHSAALGRNPNEMIQYLVAHGVDINAKDSRGETPLQAAARIHRAGTLMQLLDLGADVNAANDRGETALHQVANMGINLSSERARRAESANVLIKNKATIDAKDNDGRTALHLAAAKGRTALSKVLVKSGANIHALDAQGRNPMHYAALMNQPEIMAQLLKAEKAIENTSDSQSLISIQDKEGNTSLHVAALRFRKDATEWLLKNGASVTTLNKKKQTPLIVLAATTHGHRDVDSYLVPIAEALIESGVNVNHKDITGKSAMDYATKNQYSKLALLLKNASK